MAVNFKTPCFRKKLKLCIIKNVVAPNLPEGHVLCPCSVCLVSAVKKLNCKLFMLDQTVAYCTRSFKCTLHSRIRCKKVPDKGKIIRHIYASLSVNDVP